MVQIRMRDAGTDYAKALIGGDNAGAAHSTDAQLMAGYCENVLQRVMGAFSPRLVWEGAQAKGMTAAELAALCAPSTSARRKAANETLNDLMWVWADRYQGNTGR